MEGSVKTYGTQWLNERSRGAKRSAYLSTKNVLTNHVFPVIGNKKVEDLTVKDIAAVHDEMAHKGLAPSSIGNNMGILS